jgi:hypothetical protein
MTTLSDLKEKAIAQNYAAFQRILPSVLIAHQRQTALLRHGVVVDYFDSPVQAIAHGKASFDDSLFSIQKVASSAEAVEFGWYSHV